MASPLKDRIQADLTEAIRAQDSTTVSTLRLVLTAVTRAETAGTAHSELDDDAVLAVISAEVKRRIEAATTYSDAGRPDRADAERAEQVVLERYLPAALSDAELATVVAEEVAAARAAGHEGKAATGVVIKAVRARAGAGTDGRRIAEAVQAALA
ncbi:MAG: GatB/YqeY domain-containing protein [Actinobacteria bacterium]|nr:GatB/YqeY domain-containing protein [Actinomycetota bacterium]